MTKCCGNCGRSVLFGDPLETVGCYHIVSPEVRRMSPGTGQICRVHETCDDWVPDWDDFDV
jgi:hypothetical protein